MGASPVLKAQLADPPLHGQLEKAAAKPSKRRFQSGLGHSWLAGVYPVAPGTERYLRRCFLEGHLGFGGSPAAALARQQGFTVGNQVGQEPVHFLEFAFHLFGNADLARFK